MGGEAGAGGGGELFAQKSRPNFGGLTGGESGSFVKTSDRFGRGRGELLFHRFLSIVPFKRAFKGSISGFLFRSFYSGFGVEG